MPETTIDNRIPAKTILAAIAKGKLGDARYWRANGHDVFSILVTNAQDQPILKISRLHENDTQYMVIFRRQDASTGRIPVKDTLRVNQTPEQIKALIEERLPKQPPKQTKHIDGFRAYTYNQWNHLGRFRRMEWEKHPQLGECILIRMPNPSCDLVIARSGTYDYDIFPAGMLNLGTDKIARDSHTVFAVAERIAHRLDGPARHFGKESDDDTLKRIENQRGWPELLVNIFVRQIHDMAQNKGQGQSR